MKNFLKQAGVFLAAGVVGVLVIAMVVFFGVQNAEADYGPVVFYNGLGFNMVGAPLECGNWWGTAGFEDTGDCNDLIYDYGEWMRKNFHTYLDLRNAPGGWVIDWDFSVHVPAAASNQNLRNSTRFQVAVKDETDETWIYCNAYWNSSYPEYFTCSIDNSERHEYSYVQMKMERIAPYYTGQVYVNKAYFQYTVDGTSVTPTFTPRAR